MPVHRMRESFTSYSVKDLSPDTWKDFEQLFARHSGMQSGCWCMYYHTSHQTPGKTQEERSENNMMGHRGLVSEGKARGILIYDGDLPVGWCQYGTRDELPRMANGRVYKTLERIPDSVPLWRITCFFVDRDYRRRGVAKIALTEAISRIRQEGGGIVEAFPVTHSKAYSTWFGSVSMYEKLGFEVVTPIGRSNVLMRLNI